MSDQITALLDRIAGQQDTIDRLCKRVGALVVELRERGGDQMQTNAIKATDAQGKGFGLHANPRRTKLEILNVSAVDIEWGDPALIRNGAQQFGQFRKIPAGMGYSDESAKCYRGAVSIITAAANAVVDVRVSEEFLSSSGAPQGDA